MPAAPASPENTKTSIFRDGLGERFIAAEPASGELVQMLHLPPAMAEVPAFEFALRERASRLATFRNASYVRVYRVERVQDPAPGLSVVSEHVEGVRLSDLLRVAHERSVDVDISTALSVIRQVLPATALLHEHAPDVANGLIGPERLVVTPRARVAIAEQVLCVAIEQLHYSPERLWRELRIAALPGAPAARFSHRTDVMSIGLVALALVLGRPLNDADFPGGLAALLDTARERSALGYERPLSQPLRNWIRRALQLERHRSFASAPEAWLEFEKMVAADPLYLSTPIALEMFLYSCTAALIQPAPVAKAPAAPPAVLASEPPPVQAAPSLPPAAPVTSTPPAIVSEPEMQAQMLPPYPLGAAATHRTSEGDSIDWTTIAAQPNAVVTSRDISELFTDADLSSDGPAIPSSPMPPSLPSPNHPDVRPGAPADFAMDGDPETDAGTTRNAMASTPWAERIPLSRSMKVRRTAAAAAIVTLLAGGVALARVVRSSAAPASGMGTVIVDTNPAGLQIFVDGIETGRTPARLALTAGEHVLEVRGGGSPRVLPLKVAGGSETSQYLEFATVQRTGQLRVESQPAGATVLVDGVSRGVTPITLADLTPGDRSVVLQTAAGSSQHTVNIQAGAAASLSVPAAPGPVPATPTWGWLAVEAAFPVEIRVGGKIIGTPDAERVRLGVGRHEVELVNEAQGYRAVHVVYVVPGKVTKLATGTSANGRVNLNASPWAEVWIGGRRIGETPLANVSIPLGRHEVVFRHPELGEKRQGISVTAGAPVRLSVDMK